MKEIGKEISSFPPQFPPIPKGVQGYQLNKRESLAPLIPSGFMTPKLVIRGHRCTLGVGMVHTLSTNLGKKYIFCWHALYREVTLLRMKFEMLYFRYDIVVPYQKRTPLKSINTRLALQKANVRAPRGG